MLSVSYLWLVLDLVDVALASSLEDSLTSLNETRVDVIFKICRPRFDQAANANYLTNEIVTY